MITPGNAPQVGVQEATEAIVEKQEMRQSDEEFVRRHWTKIRTERDFGFHIWFADPEGDPYLFVEEQRDAQKQWAAAAEFTRTRLEQIRQIEEEIRWMTGIEWAGQVGYNAPTVARILAREQEALAELQKGMRHVEPD
jgi:hypothetical protein